MKKYTLISVMLLFTVPIGNALAQKILSMEEVLDMAIKNSAYLHYYYLDLEKHQFINKGTLNLPDPLVSIKIFNKNTQAASIRQYIDITSIYSAINKNLNGDLELSKNKYLIALQNFKKDILEIYLKSQYLNELTKVLKLQSDKLKQVVFNYSKTKTKNKLSAAHRLIIDSTLKDIYSEYLSKEIDFLSTVKIIKGIAGINYGKIEIPALEAYEYPDMYIQDNMADSNIEKIKYSQSLHNLKLEKLKLVPNVFLQWNHTINGNPNGYLVNYFEVGLSVPIFFGKYNLSIKQAKFDTKVAQERLNILQQEKWKNLQIALSQINSIETKLNHFDNNLLESANKIMIEVNNLDDFYDENLLHIIDLINKAYTIRTDYLHTLYSYNKAVIQIKFINNSL
ncbi:MAG: TolC family protein [Solitalea-like symbiont of Tyrophagus putrescentiae]